MWRMLMWKSSMVPFRIMKTEDRERNAGMNLHQMLLQREKEGRPIRVGLIGAAASAQCILRKLALSPASMW